MPPHPKNSVCTSVSLRPFASGCATDAAGTRGQPERVARRQPKAAGVATVGTAIGAGAAQGDSDAAWRVSPHSRRFSRRRSVCQPGSRSSMRAWNFGPWLWTYRLGVSPPRKRPLWVVRNVCIHGQRRIRPGRGAHGRVQRCR